MKHAYKIILAILLAVVLAVPAFATELSYNGYEAGDYKEADIDHAARPFAVIGENSSGYKYLYFFDEAKNLNRNTDQLMTWEDPCYSWTYVQEGLNGPGEWKWDLRNSKVSELITPIWANYDIYKMDGTTLFLAGSEPSIPVCDGSSCPATDANVDGICDDCSMTLSLRSLTYPTLPSTDGSNAQTALVKTKYSGVDAYMYSVFSSDSTYTIQGTSPGTVYQIAVDGVAQYKQYVTTDGQNWVGIQDGSVNDQTVGSGVIANTTVVSSTFNWYDDSGTLFFPVPLWEEMGQVTQGEMGVLTQETMETVSTLVLCGVGCLALLMLLSLLGRKSQIFHL